MRITAHAARALDFARALSTWFATRRHRVPSECRAAFLAGMEASSGYEEGYRAGFSAGRCDGERAGYEQGTYDARVAQQLADTLASIPGRLVDCDVRNDRGELIGRFDHDGEYHPMARPVPVLRTQPAVFNRNR